MPNTEKKKICILPGCTDEIDNIDCKKGQKGAHLCQLYGHLISLFYGAHFFTIVTRVLEVKKGCRDNKRKDQNRRRPVRG